MSGTFVLRRRRWAFSPRQLVVLLLYGAAFTLLREMSSAWGTAGLFSLWFPAAGLRFAFLWRCGARLAPGAALGEALVQLASGMNSLWPYPLLAIAGIVGPCLAYGAVIGFVRARVSGRAPVVGAQPLPFAIAAVIGPLVACLTALLWAVPRALQTGTLDGEQLFTSMLVFALGDMLGVILVAPPLLWLAERFSGRQSWTVELPRREIIAEVVLVFMLAWALVWGMRGLGLGLELAPVLLATCWLGLRTGRGGAWIAILVTAALCLPLTGLEGSEVERLRVHMLLACVAAIGYLAASFAEAEGHSMREIARRDRLLYHADRLKTLRGMSLALIHEISQPLSTIAIEARNLDELTAGSASQPDVREAVRLIARKSDDLSQLVRRLRRFGDRRAEQPAVLAVTNLLQDVCAIAGPEATASRVPILAESGADAAVPGHEVELRQAMLNLVRNAIAASPAGEAVTLSCRAEGKRVLLSVENRLGRKAQRAGMGVGLIIARTIAEAHAGSIRSENLGPDRVRYTLDLPAFEGPHG